MSLTVHRFSPPTPVSQTTFCAYCGEPLLRDTDVGYTGLNPNNPFDDDHGMIALCRSCASTEIEASAL